MRGRSIFADLAGGAKQPGALPPFRCEPAARLDDPTVRLEDCSSPARILLRDNGDQSLLGN